MDKQSRQYFTKQKHGRGAGVSGDLNKERNFCNSVVRVRANANCPRPWNNRKTAFIGPDLNATPKPKEPVAGVRTGASTAVRYSKRKYFWNALPWVEGISHLGHWEGGYGTIVQEQRTEGLARGSEQVMEGAGLISTDPCPSRNTAVPVLPNALQGQHSHAN